MPLGLVCTNYLRGIGLEMTLCIGEEDPHWQLSGEKQIMGTIPASIHPMQQCGWKDLLQVKSPLTPRAKAEHS